MNMILNYEIGNSTKEEETDKHFLQYMFKDHRSFLVIPVRTTDALQLQLQIYLHPSKQHSPLCGTLSVHLIHTKIQQTSLVLL